MIMEWFPPNWENMFEILCLKIWVILWTHNPGEAPQRERYLFKSPEIECEFLPNIKDMCIGQDRLDYFAK